ALRVLGLLRGTPLVELDHREVRTGDLDQRQLVVRLADDVLDAARLTGAVHVGGLHDGGVPTEGHGDAAVLRPVRAPTGLVLGTGGLLGVRVRIRVRVRVSCFRALARLVGTLAGSVLAGLAVCRRRAGRLGGGRLLGTGGGAGGDGGQDGSTDDQGRC